MPDKQAVEAIAAANREIRNGHIAALSHQLADMHTRQQLRVLDDLIAALEERNLKGDRLVDRAIRKWVRHLEDEVAVPLPRQVLRARTTARLHGALLDWMETVFDELIPEGRSHSQRLSSLNRPGQ